MYVRRDAEGRIEAVSRRQSDGFPEFVDPNDSELNAFLADAGHSEPQARLASTDIELVRVLEDLVDVLVRKEVIRFTDLPEAAQQKLMQRRVTRVNMRDGLNLMDFDDSGGAV